MKRRRELGTRKPTPGRLRRAYKMTEAGLRRLAAEMTRRGMLTR